MPCKYAERSMKTLSCLLIDVDFCVKFQLVFDNYTSSSAPSDVLPSPSRSRKVLANTAPVEDSLPQELEELRQQLQYAKKQTLVVMEQSRRASEAEKIALQQAQEAMATKEIAVSEAEKATARENFMLELMNEASADMSGMLVASFFIRP
jgi:hypothetical protein